MTVAEDREVDLKWLHAEPPIAQGTLSFGSAGALEKFLGVVPGAVTPLGIINDTNSAVTAFLDKDLLDATLINAHPLRNDMTTALSAQDLVTFMETLDHPPGTVDFDADVWENSHVWIIPLVSVKQNTQFSIIRR